MALARKCDVCGVLYEEYEISIEKIGCCNGIAFIHKGFRDWDARKFFDCCPDCFNGIQNYMKALKDRNKEKENA